MFKKRHVKKGIKKKTSLLTTYRGGEGGTTITRQHAELRQVHFCEKELIKRIESQTKLIRKPTITDVLALNEEILVVEGTFFFSYVGDDEVGYEYPYFGMLLQKTDTFVIEEFTKLLQVLLISGKYFFVTYWQQPECGKRGLVVYTLEKGSLEWVFSDHSDAT